MKLNKKVKLYNQLYNENTNYKRNLKPMFNIINSTLNFKCNSFLDYGCGNSNLSDFFENILNSKVYKYDPAIEKYSKLPDNLRVDLIANCDVMEHIPEDEIDNLLFEMSKISKNIFFNIYLKEAKTFLPNGENARCTIKPISWWKSKIKKYFKTIYIIPTTYKNSVTIITWKISKKNYLKLLYINLLTFVEYIIWLFRIKILRKN